MWGRCGRAPVCRPRRVSPAVRGVVTAGAFVLLAACAPAPSADAGSGRDSGTGPGTGVRAAAPPAVRQDGSAATSTGSVTDNAPAPSTVGAASSGSVGAKDSRSTTVGAPSGSCPGAPVRVSRDAVPPPGVDGGGAPPPIWSGTVGHILAVGSGELLAERGEGCVVAVGDAAGSTVWSWAVPGTSIVMGGEAAPRVVLVATGDTRGRAPAMVYAATDRLIALDPGTGAQRWSIRLADDGQGVPAVIAGNLVVLARADGTVLGLDASTGARRWLDPLPNGCHPDDTSSGLSPAAVVLPGLPDTVVLYQCAGRQRLARLDPVTGAVRWTRALPAGWSVQYQSPAGSAAGVIGLLVQGRGAAIAPVTEPAPPGPRGYQTDSVIAVSAATGGPLWQLNGVPPSAGVYAGGDRLCVLSGFGVACEEAATGSEAWHWAPPVAPTDGGPAGPGFTSAVIVAGRLYLAVPTRAAGSIPAQSTTYRSPAGTFQLRVVDIASGRMRAAIPLPAYYGGSQEVVVSADSPPGVIAVTNGTAFIDPELDESDVVEAISVAGRG